MSTNDNRRSLQAGFATAAALSGILIAGLAAGVMFQGWSSTQRSTAAITRSSNNDAFMLQARSALISEHVDLDSDGAPEAPAPRTGVTPIPTGGGQIPLSSKAPKSDGYGVAFGYCAFKNGTGADRAGYIRNTSTSTGSEVSFAIISAGADKSMQTTCAQALAGTTTGDDKVSTYSLADVSLSGVNVSGSGGSSLAVDTQNKQIACVAKGKLYAGSVSGADADGCVAPAGSGGIVTDSQGRLATSCLHISQIVSGPSDGEYLLLGVPHDGGLPSMYPTECDFTTQGGKWTLVAKYDPSAACPATMKPGGVCTSPAQGIDLMDFSRTTMDLTSVRALTNAIKYVKPWSELLMMDANGGWTMWACPANTMSWQERFASSQNTQHPYADCTVSNTSFGPSVQLNSTLPRMQINLTGMRQMTSTPHVWSSCPVGQGCAWNEHANRGSMNRDAGYVGGYYFNDTYFVTLPSLLGYVDFQNRVCAFAPLAILDQARPMEGTLTNGCRGAYTGSFRGPWNFDAGPYRAWNYDIDYAGDTTNRIPNLAHLGPQPRPNQVWAPTYKLRIAGTNMGSFGSMEHHKLGGWTGLPGPTWLPPATDNDRCRFGYAYDPEVPGVTWTGAGVFFFPTHHFNYGSGTVTSVNIGYGGEWLEAYMVYNLTGGNGMQHAIPGYISLKTAMIPGGAGQVLCAGKREIWNRYSAGDQCYNGNPQWITLYATGSLSHILDWCLSTQFRSKVEVPFASLPGAAPEGVVKGYLPVDIRKIYIR